MSRESYLHTQADLTSRRREVDMKINEASGQRFLRDDVPRDPEELKAAYEGGAYEWRRAFIESLVEKITIGPGVRGLNKFDPRRWIREGLTSSFKNSMKSPYAVRLSSNLWSIGSPKFETSLELVVAPILTPTPFSASLSGGYKRRHRSTTPRTALPMPCSSRPTAALPPPRSPTPPTTTVSSPTTSRTSPTPPTTASPTRPPRLLRRRALRLLHPPRGCARASPTWRDRTP
jgi:hypothetical protein